MKALSNIILAALFAVTIVSCSVPVCRHNVTTQFAWAAEQRLAGDTRIVVIRWWDQPGLRYGVHYHAMVQVKANDQWRYLDEESNEVIRWVILEPPADIVRVYYSLAEYEADILRTP